MMYANKLAAAIKVNGRVLREVEDTVYIPFGAEYAISLKNLNSVRALVHIDIDGKDVTGGGLVLNANQTIDLERFIESGNLERGLRFKFIERTQKIEDGPRGAKLEDGIVRVRFAFDVTPVYRPRPSPFRFGSAISKGLGDYGGGSQLTRGGSGDFLNTQNATFYDASSRATAASGESYATMDSYVPEPKRATSLPKNDVGITVGGSLSNQSFVTVEDFKTGPEEVMVFRLLGAIGEEPVVQPMTVKTRVECPTCGTSNKFGAKFCPDCGTGLIQV